MGIYNDPDGDKKKLGFINSRGTYIDESTGAVIHNDPIYLEITRCYVNCLVTLPFEIEIQCKGGNDVIAHVPQFSTYPSRPVRLLVGKDGSTYYLDETHDGEGPPLTVKEALDDAHLARKAGK